MNDLASVLTLQRRPPHYEIHEQERDTLLAALRHWQTLLSSPQAKRREFAWLFDIATHGGVHRACTTAEIDDLCQRLVNPPPR